MAFQALVRINGEGARVPLTAWRLRIAVVLDSSGKREL